MHYGFVLHVVNQMNIVAFLTCYFIFTSSTATAGVQGLFVQGRGLRWMVVLYGSLLVFVVFALGIGLPSGSADGIMGCKTPVGMHARLL